MVYIIFIIGLRVFIFTFAYFALDSNINHKYYTKMNLLDLTSNELAEFNKDNTFVIVPLGSVEQHGPHLPLGTKCFLAETIAFEAAKKLKPENIDYVIAPVVPFMPCNTSAGFNGCFFTSARTFSDMIYDIGCSFYDQGFRRLFFVNMSISPEAIKAVQIAVDDLNKLNNYIVADPMPLWTFSKNDKLESILKKAGIEASNEIHGDIKETSALLHLDKQLLRSDLAYKLPPCIINKTWEVLKGHFSYKEMGSELGYLGSPAKATPEIGRFYIENAAQGLYSSMMYLHQGNALPELPLQIRMLLKMVDIDEM